MIPRFFLLHSETFQYLDQRTGISRLLPNFLLIVPELFLAADDGQKLAAVLLDPREDPVALLRREHRGRVGGRQAVRRQQRRADVQRFEVIFAQSSCGQTPREENDPQSAMFCQLSPRKCPHRTQQRVHYVVSGSTPDGVASSPGF